MSKYEMIKWLQNLKKDIGKSQHQDLWHYAEMLDEVIGTIESRQKGRWIDIRCEGFTYQGTCSVCDRRNDIPHPLSAKYCPNCGAEMRSEE